MRPRMPIWTVNGTASNCKRHPKMGILCSYGDVAAEGSVMRSLRCTGNFVSICCRLRWTGRVLGRADSPVPTLSLRTAAYLQFRCLEGSERWLRRHVSHTLGWQR